MDIGKIFSSIFGGAAGAVDPVAAGANAVDAVHKFVGLFKVDATLKAQMEQQLTLANLDEEKTAMARQIGLLQSQLEINKAEAASANWFVAGWRPYIGWVCGTGLLYAVLIQPLLTFILLACGVHLPADQLPKLDLAQILAILSPMMGLGVARTVEKVTGTAANH